MPGKGSKSVKSHAMSDSVKSVGPKVSDKKNNGNNDALPPSPKEVPKPVKRQEISEVSPGFYALPSTIGFIEHDPTKKCQPAFTIASVREPKARKKGSSYDSVPGPQYNFWDVTRFGAIPQSGAIITSRNQSKKVEDSSPGPGRYAPEQHESPGHRTAPQATLLGRTEPPAKHHLTPSPGQYAVPSTLGENHPVYISAPSATINGRSWDKQKLGEKNVYSPGPNQYFNYELNTFYRSSPSARILGRTKGKFEVGPGPGKYNADYIQGAGSPAFSFGVRHSKKAGVLRESEEY